MTTCGDNDHVRDQNDPLFGLQGKSLEEKRLETLMTATGFIRGSFVSNTDFTLYDSEITCFDLSSNLKCKNKLYLKTKLFKR